MSAKQLQSIKPFEKLDSLDVLKCWSIMLVINLASNQSQIETAKSGGLLMILTSDEPCS